MSKELHTTLYEKKYLLEDARILIIMISYKAKDYPGLYRMYRTKPLNDHLITTISKPQH